MRSWKDLHAWRCVLYSPLHLSDLNTLATFRHELVWFFTSSNNIVNILQFSSRCVLKLDWFSIIMTILHKHFTNCPDIFSKYRKSASLKSSNSISVTQATSIKSIRPSKKNADLHRAWRAHLAAVPVNRRSDFLCYFSWQKSHWWIVTIFLFNIKRIVCDYRNSLFSREMNANSRKQMVFVDSQYTW